MKPKLLIPLLCILMFGCNGQNAKIKDTTNIYPKESFVGFTAELKGKPLVGSMNHEFKNFDKKAEFPWCLHMIVLLDTNNLFANGLPKTEESNIAYKTEDSLLALIRNIEPAQYVGHFFNDGFLDIFFYVQESKKIDDFFRLHKDDKRVREFGWDIEKDVSWSKVEEYMRDK